MGLQGVKGACILGMTRSRFSILFKWFMGLCKGPTPSWALITRRELRSLQGLCVLCVLLTMCCGALFL